MKLPRTISGQVSLLLLVVMLASHVLVFLSLLAFRLETRPHARPHPPPLRLMAVIAVIAVPTALAGFWTSRRITAPLRALAAHAEAVEGHEGWEPMKLAGAAEIQGVAQSFNQLIDRLAAQAENQRRLIAAISHDLRSPLTRLRMRLEQVQDESLRLRLLHDVQVLQSLVQSTLSLTRAQENQIDRERTDAGALLQTIADNFTDAGENIQLTATARPVVNVDRAMITRAIENLVQNALKFAGSAELHLHAAATEACIEIRDTGPGIPDAQKNLAFEPFFRADESRTTEGSGLGLPIARAIVAAHGGRLELTNNTPNGLCAKLFLPSTERRAPEKLEAAT